MYSGHTSPSLGRYPAPLGCHLLGRHPLGRHPQADTPLGRHPIPQAYPQDRHPPPPQDGHCSGRYASYWNAFLCVIDMPFPSLIFQVNGKTETKYYIICHKNSKSPQTQIQTLQHNHNSYSDRDQRHTSHHWYTMYQRNTFGCFNRADKPQCVWPLRSWFLDDSISCLWFILGLIWSS